VGILFPFSPFSALFSAVGFSDDGSPRRALACRL
jgi:hypothetical protein